MARPQNQKRQRVDELSRTDTEPPTKKIKTQSEVELDAWASWEYPSKFWDGLSNISLSHKALREFDKRTSTRRCLHSAPASRDRLDFHFDKSSQDLARFARHGGPDLRDLRGISSSQSVNGANIGSAQSYPPTNKHHHSDAMSASQSSRSRRTRSTDQASTLPTSATSKTRKSTPFNRDFDLHLTEHLVHAVYSSQEPELDDVTAALAVPRPSLSPSVFSDSAFKAFRASDARAKDEDDVLANAIPAILGPSQPDHFCARNTVFANLEPLTDDTIVAAKPDIYYGSYPEQLARSARNELAGHIVPSTMEDKPMAPNFFLEVKGPDGHAAVATRQARYDGAIGSRAMHSLQNYGLDEPEYDGKAYTFSSTYHDGTLKMYAHHVTAPTGGALPEYHMTQVKGYAMTSDRDTFVRGATAFRNARDLAKQHRDNFIQAATGRAPQETGAHLGLETMTTIQQEDSPGESAPVLQNHITDIQDEDSPDELALSPCHHLHDGDGSQNTSQETTASDPDPSVSFATSFTTSFTTGSSRWSNVKRQRSPRSGDQGGKALKRPIRRMNTANTALPAKSADTAAGAAERLWVETYWRKGKVCFKNPQDREIKTDVKDWVERVLDDGTESIYWQNPKSGQVFWAKALAIQAKKNVTSK